MAITPFAPSTGWMRIYLKALYEGASEESSREQASTTERIDGKKRARAFLPELTLSVPVEGGSGQLKRRASTPRLSSHGKWRREHLGAWNAAYGRTPYYIHLMPQIEEAYMSTADGAPLSELNDKLLDIAKGWLEYESVAQERDRLSDIINAYKTRVRNELSIFDLIFRYGKESVFALF